MGENHSAATRDENEHKAAIRRSYTVRNTTLFGGVAGAATTVSQSCVVYIICVCACVKVHSLKLAFV